MKKTFISTPPVQKKLSERKAFALVLSLALMGFMVLLIVTLATMVQMQMRLSRQSMNDFKAKQAAKFAAYQAMSRVQSALGPDQRITANAMMFDDTVASPITELDNDKKFEWWSSPMNIDRDEAEKIDDAAISQNRYWVGVWDSRRGYSPEKQLRQQARSDYVTNTVERALTWLVSGNKIREKESTDYSVVRYRPTSKLDDGKYVRAVSAGSYSDEYGAPRSDRDVLAPLVTLDVDPNPITGEKISDGKETRIAWWVADEGQKASLNAVATEDMFEHANRINYRIQSLPFYSGIHGLTVSGMGGKAGTKAFDLDFRDGDDQSSMARIRNLDDIKQLDIFRSGSLPDNTLLSRVFFHSASFNTKGILVNVRDGGLKKDLSLGLTRKDFGNEDEELLDKDNNNATEYFERPYGVAGFDFKTTAYPLVKDNVYKYHHNPNKSGEPDRKLRGTGHIFGPQMYGHENTADAESLSTIRLMADMFDDKYIWKDPGGPLWDQLRSYYNTRTEDLADRETLDARVQTDDRYGLKPVVKRFQVFYVPTFVNYGGQKYGLRLHIMPLLILYNPYDTKIKGDTYYAIRVWGQFRHPTGAFRFAIGYETGQYFQCLRDLRTEIIPSMSDEVTRADPDKKSLRQFMLPFRRGTVWGRNEQTDSGTIVNNINPTSNNDYPIKWLMSRYTAFFEGFRYGNTDVPAFPLGYGIKQNMLSQADIKSAIAPTDINVSETFKWRHWKDIVADGNIVPSSELASERATAGRNRYAARVARIPLYLNSIIYAVTHGSYFNSILKDPDAAEGYLFFAQRSIDARNPENASKIYTAGDGNTDDANLRFMAYDAKGIEPGKAKIFSMKKIISYVGNPKNKGSSSDQDKDGPNGVLEENATKSLYEERNAMMYGLDNGGVLGGCFYVDIPHPEAEHAAKYDNDTDWQYRDRLGKYVLFDLDLIAACNIKDVNGANMETNINNLYIDMQDIEGVYPRKEMWGMEDHKMLGASFNMTPLGYAISSYNLDYTRPSDCSTNPPNTNARYWNPIHRHQLEYVRLNLDIWIWKREGFEFAKFCPTYAKNTGKDFTAGLQIMGPSLMHMRGFRFFCFKQPSFPDPSIGAYGQKTQSGEAQNYYVYTNYHCPGEARMDNGRSLFLAAYRNTDTNSNGAWYSDGVNGGGNQTVDGALKQLLGFGTPFSTNAAGNDESQLGAGSTKATEPIHRARFYINWLTLNPRRHSANYWKNHDNCRMYNSSSQYIPSVDATGICMDTEGLGDTLPQAIRHNKDLSINSTNYNYAQQLYASINDTTGRVPYGLIFAQPYANSSAGHEPFFNVRPFVNSNIHATGYYGDWSGREIPISGEKKTLYNTISRLTKTMQSLNQAYGTKDGMTYVGNSLVGVADGHVRIGLKEELGTYQAPVIHVLRKTEVVSNPANLAGAGLSFGIGKYQGTTWLYEDTASGSYANLVNSDQFQRSYGLQTNESQYPTLAIGNSLCPARISPERAYHVTWLDGASAVWDRNDDNNSVSRSGKFDGKRESAYYEDRGVLYDIAWQLNDALWDEYFFSTLPYRKDESKNTIDQEYAYPQNPRIRYAVERDDYLSLRDLTSDSNKEQFEENASKFWVNGAFNVNSTSVDAWKAVLSTYYGQEIRDYQGKSLKLEQSDAAAFHRWQAPYSAKEFTSSSSITEEDTAFQGFRALSAEEIEELAVAIVEHVKDRGPFYSMSHFVNRVVPDLSAEQRYTEEYLGNGKVPLPSKLDDRKNLEKEYDDQITYRVSHAQKGVLQAAIDSTSINYPFHTDKDFIISIDNNRNMSEALQYDNNCKDYQDVKKIWENWRGAIGPQATGAPAYLMQQDLLARLGSFLTVRSDTFKIRAYGEVRNPVSGAVEGKAWCEMLVQRMPEYFDSESQNQEPWRISGREHEIGYQEKVNDQRNFNTHVDELNDLNKELGRRFKIVSFRWLNEKEI